MLKAQQTVQYSLNMMNPYGYNPAYAAVNKEIEVVGVFRSQWQGLRGNPRSQQISAYAPVPYLNGGLGMKIENDKVGALNLTQAALGYAYAIQVGKRGLLSLGMRGGVLLAALDGRKLLAPQGNYQGTIFLHNDNYIPESNINTISYQLDLGIYLKTFNFGFGLSSVHTTEPNLDFKIDNVSKNKFFRHYTALITYKFDIGNDFVAYPAVWAKTNTIQHQLDVSFSTVYVEQFTIGLLYRGYNVNTSDAFGIFGGWKFMSNWELLYAFDIPLSGLNVESHGSHELILKYNLEQTIGKGQMPKRIHTPRLL